MNLENDLIECAAAISAQRFLLEAVYANAFVGRADAFSALMGEIEHKARNAGTASIARDPESGDRQALLEFQQRTAEHLQRFADSTAERIVELRRRMA